MDSKDASSDNIKSQTERPNDDGTKTLITVYDDGKTTAITYDSDGNSVLDQTYYPTDTKESTPEQDSTRDSEKTTISDTTTEITGENISGYTGESSGSGQLDYNDNGHNSSSSNPSTANNEEENLSTQTPEVKIVEIGTFGQITDGSYADELTMQYYKRSSSDAYCDDWMFGSHIDKDTKEVVGNKFSEVGCKEACTAKILSEISGHKVTLVEINRDFDKNKDGNLIKDEIAEGMNYYLDSLFGDIQDIKSSEYSKLSLEQLSNISESNNSDDTYMLGYAPNCYGGHWIVLEGYTKNSKGLVSFTYDGSSDNDIGRTYVLGIENQNTDSNIFAITKIQTFSVISK